MTVYIHVLEIAWLFDVHDKDKKFFKMLEAKEMYNKLLGIV